MGTGNRTWIFCKNRKISPVPENLGEGGLYSLGGLYHSGWNGILTGAGGQLGMLHPQELGSNG